ncbi:MAG TPA: zinc metallopeptidase, partial [Anaerovoracaceae bacterium]|nr:zinc metallopeptidase [Anaerovoracaceae bacterium]
YANVRNTTGMTGAQVARMILDTNGLSDVPIQRIPGNLTDNYNPLQRTMNLSDAVYSTPSVASISIAAHEAGHAIQHSTAYAPLKFRNAIVPVVNIGSMAAWPLLFIGLIIGPGMGDVLFNLGVVLFMGVVIFHLVTLPVELDASKRAIAQLVAVGAVSTQEESVAAQKVLSAAALTYIAALAMAVANLLRIFLMRRN